jgi:hypothetical protein
VIGSAFAMAVLAACGSGGSQPPTTATGPTVASVTPVPDRGAKTTTTGAGKGTAAGAHATKHAAHPATGKTPPATKATHGATPKPTTTTRTPTTPTTSTIKAPANPVLAGTLPGVLPLARTSVNQVVLLHDLAVGTTHLAGAPPGVGGAAPAAQLATTLSGEAEQLKVPAGSAQPSGVALLTASLNGYAGLAKQLAARPAADTTPLSASFVATLRKLDGRWTAALVAIGSANHVKLLTGMAPLLIPHSG